MYANSTRNYYIQLMIKRHKAEVIGNYEQLEHFQLRQPFLYMSNVQLCLFRKTIPFRSAAFRCMKHTKET